MGQNMTPLEEEMLQDVCNNPRNPFPCNVLADYYLDTGDALRAECWRLMADTGIFPSHEPEHPDAISGAWWWNTNIQYYPPESVVPDKWSSKMKNGGWWYSKAKNYKTCKQAFYEAVEAYVRLTEIMRTKIKEELLTCPTSPTKNTQD